VESRNGKQEEVILRWTIRSAYRVKCLNWAFQRYGEVSIDIQYLQMVS
jgi:hypothetical protein